jgi:hypothetical protein
MVRSESSASLAHSSVRAARSRTSSHAVSAGFCVVASSGVEAERPRWYEALLQRHGHEDVARGFRVKPRLDVVASCIVPPSTLSFPVLLSVVLSLACDSPSKETPTPAKAPTEVGTRTAEPQAKVVPPPAAPTEVKEAVGEPAGAAEAAPSPTEAAPTKAEPAPAGAADAPTAIDPPPKAKPEQPSPPEAATARKADDGRPAKAFTDCRSSEAFADGRCYSSSEAACEALSCAGKCIHTRSKPPQVLCG